jgi:mRNA interferase RelE/StbE
MYQLHLLDAAIDDLAKLDKSIARRIVTRLRWLAEHLEGRRLERLTGELLGFYKFRVGDYRVLYEIFRTEQTLVIHRIGHRREIYKRIKSK